MTRKEGNLPEKKVRRILETFLTSQGWTFKVPSSDRGIDIEAKKGTQRWVIEIKGVDSVNHEIIDSFVSILGKTLQRMKQEKCKYSVALPDMKPFRRLWERLPSLAKSRTGITALFVTRDGDVSELN
jgi:hypothetical protein